MATFRKLIRIAAGFNEDGVMVRIGTGTGVYLSHEVLDPNLLRDLEVASRPTICPSPIMVLQLQTPTSIPWTVLDLGPWTANPADPTPGKKGTASSVILYCSVAGAGGIELYVRRAGAPAEAGIYRHGSKFEFFNSILMFVALDEPQLIEYRVEGKGTVEIRFIGYFDRPVLTLPAT